MHVGFERQCLNITGPFASGFPQTFYS